VLRRVLASLGLLLSAASCSGGAVVRPTAQVAAAPLHYEDPATWLCRPDLPTDACRVDLDATELRLDGTRVVAAFVPAAEPTVDCFYVYPTVDVGMVPGNHDDFTDSTSMRELAHNQAARFREACRVFAPLYRQVTIATYFEPAETREPRFQMAFADVLAAFRYYLAHADGTRKIVLIGHSQGAEMVTRLLHTLFDGDASMRARLLVAIPLGGVIDVPEGRSVGGTFENLPLCTSPDELACVVAFRTYRAEHPVHSWDGPPPRGRRTACVNPADVVGNEQRLLSGAVIPTRSKFRPDAPAAQGTTTPFILLRNFYRAQCVDGKDGFRYLAVEAAPAQGDVRTNPVNFDEVTWRSPLGLHLLDFQLPLEELVQMVKHKAKLGPRTP
jgi:pimeloyl-ACP methyl ester carboxylesterase